MKAVYDNHVAGNVHFRLAPSRSNPRQREELRSDILGNSKKRSSICNFASGECSTEDKIMSLDELVKCENPSRLLLWRQLTIRNIWSQLQSDKLLKDVYKDEFDASNEDNYNDKQLEHYPLDRSALSKPENVDLLYLCTYSKEQSIAFQNYLEESSQEYVERVAALMVPLYADLIFDKIGCYMLIKMIQISDKTERKLSSYCRSNFNLLINNEYASRVIQQLIELCDGFRQFCLWFFEMNFEYCLKVLPAVYLITACIKASKNKSQLTFVIRSLRKNPRLLSLRMFQKVLFTYVKVAPQNSLLELCEMMQIESKFKHYFNDKYTVYIIYSLITQGIHTAIDALQWLIENESHKLFASRFFKLLLLKLLSTFTNCHSKSIISQVAVKILDTDLLSACQNEKDYQVLILASLSDPLSAETTNLKKLLGRFILCPSILDLISEIKLNKTKEPTDARGYPHNPIAAK